MVFIFTSCINDRLDVDISKFKLKISFVNLDSLLFHTPKNNIPIIKIKAGAKLIKGYAWVISNLVIAAIQKSEAINAEAKPENINGSKIILVK